MERFKTKYRDVVNGLPESVADVAYLRVYFVTLYGQADFDVWLGLTTALCIIVSVLLLLCLSVVCTGK